MSNLLVILIQISSSYTETQVPRRAQHTHFILSTTGSSTSTRLHWTLHTTNPVPRDLTSTTQHRGPEDLWEKQKILKSIFLLLEFIENTKNLWPTRLVLPFEDIDKSVKVKCNYTNQKQDWDHTSEVKINKPGHRALVSILQLSRPHIKITKCF